MELILQQEQPQHLLLLLVLHLVAHGVIVMALGQLILLVLVELNHVHVQSLVQELAKRLIAHISLKQPAVQRQKPNLVVALQALLMGHVSRMHNVVLGVND